MRTWQNPMTEQRLTLPGGSSLVIFGSPAAHREGAKPGRWRM